METLTDGAGGVDGLEGAISVALSPDGKHVYVTGRFDNAVAVFQRDADTGRLSFVEALKDGVGGVDGLEGAYSVTVSPDAKHVYVTGIDESALALFSRDSTTGELTAIGVLRDGVGGIDGLNQAINVTVSPDGKHVYVAGLADNAVAMFSRNSTSGLLTYLGIVRDGAGGVDGIGGAYSVTVSPDGKHVYACGYTDNAVAVFSRDSTSGLLTFVQVLKDGTLGVEGLWWAVCVTVSPDGKHAYVIGQLDKALAVFSRDSSTGELTFVEVKIDGVGGVDGLDYGYTVTVSPDGGLVYANGLLDDALAIFARDSDTGKLLFLEVLKDGLDGVDGLDGANSVRVSSDGAFLYVAGISDNAITTLLVSSFQLFELN